MIVSKKINLPKLESELKKAGFSVNGLGMIGDNLFTYNTNGEIVDIQEEARSVINAHVPPPQPPSAEEKISILQSAVDFILMNY